MQETQMPKPSRLTDEQADAIAAVAIIIILSAAVIYWVAGG